VSVKHIDITYKHNAELFSKIITNDVVYIINTDEKGNYSTEACSRVYLNGNILFSMVADFSHLMGTDDYQYKLYIFMTQLHKYAIAQFHDMLKKSQRMKSEYLTKTTCLLRLGKPKEAYHLLKEGIKVFPDEPILLSYYGFLCSKVENQPREGIRICRDVISKLEGRSSVKREFLSPVVYMNLGKAYLAANEKIEAFKAFNIGLKSDPTHTDLSAEMKKIGIRRQPLFPFLGRSNPLNIYMGLLLSTCLEILKGPK
jgi:tetratricopeptide (TPR) repeat protein